MCVAFLVKRLSERKESAEEGRVINTQTFRK